MLANDVVAVILGGGAGSRLYPLTKTRSKPAVPIAGKYRLVDIPISNCIHSNIQRIFVLTQYNSASLNKHIKNTYQFSRFSSGFVDILAAEQTPDSANWFQGTADAVRQSLKHIEKNDFKYVLILSGDQLYQMDFSKMIDMHEANGADLSIGTIPVIGEEAVEFGILKSNEGNEITSFIEKPSKELLPNWISNTGENMQALGRNYLASMGIYVFSKELLLDVLKQNPDALDFGKNIIPSLVGTKKVMSYQYEGYWTDIGNISSFFEANLALTLDVPPFNLFGSNTVFTRARMLPPSKINGAKLNKTILAEGCIINAESISNSVIGVRSRIGEGTVIDHCFVMGNDFFEDILQINEKIQAGIPPIGIGNNCNLYKVIVDKDCRIGNNVTIKGGSHLQPTNNELYTIKDGIVVITKDAIIPDGFTLP